MSLSCECDYDGDYEWYWEQPDDYSILKTNRRQRCVSCKELIDVGSTVNAFYRYRYWKTAIEERIYGDDGEIPLATKYHCEECADLFWSLEALGFCGQPEENQHSLVAEYHQTYGTPQ